jgi:catechol 2,3-dioxygenase-like lactoylglutathione lyase family enzyme
MSVQTLIGLHHVTAICGDPQRNIDFYSGFLGLRLVKRTVNYDDPASYHLYYGDEIGSPGTILTFFAWTSVPPLGVARGKPGKGQIAAVSFATPARSLEYWIDRFADRAVDFDAGQRRFDEIVLSFHDPDGLALEIVGRDDIASRSAWKEEPVPVDHSLRAIAGATLCLEGYERTAALLRDALGFRFVGEESGRFRFELGQQRESVRVDLICQPDATPGRIGIGAVHHIAWRTPDQTTQSQWHHTLASLGYDVTPIIDRLYFHSIYFREPGGILFEIATDPPGFTIDESVAELGSSLKLPPWLEVRRTRIEAKLPAIQVKPHR